jgi:hypothetical protein
MPSQSVSWVHDLGHVGAQRPSQQMLFVPVQSEDTLHVLGHRAPRPPTPVGFRHRPGTTRLGSSLVTDVQQTSPFVVLHSVLEEHDLGHSFACVQMPLL